MRLKTTLLFSIISCCCNIQAQQVQEEEFTHIPYEYPAYREATVTMMFGSKKQVKGNIYLDGSKFYFLQDSVPIEAGLHNIHRITFGDTTYIPVDTLAARIIAQDSSKMLVCIKTIDKYKMKGSNDGVQGTDKRGEGMAFFQLDMAGAMGLLELNNFDQLDKSKRFPLKKEYFYFIDGQLIPAKERPLTRRYNKPERKKLKALIENRNWS